MLSDPVKPQWKQSLQPDRTGVAGRAPNHGKNLDLLLGILRLSPSPLPLYLLLFRVPAVQLCDGVLTVVFAYFAKLVQYPAFLLPSYAPWYRSYIA